MVVGKLSNESQAQRWYSAIRRHEGSALNAKKSSASVTGQKPIKLQEESASNRKIVHACYLCFLMLIERDHVRCFCVYVPGALDIGQNIIRRDLDCGVIEC